MLDGRRNTEEGVKIVIGGQIFPRRAPSNSPFLPQFHEGCPACPLRDPSRILCTSIATPWTRYQASNLQFVLPRSHF